MGTYIVRRLLWAVFKIWVISVITFTVFFTMGTGSGKELAIKIAGKNPSDEQVAMIMERLHLSDPLPMQYYYMMKSVVTGEIISFNSGEKVVPQALTSLPTTFSLALFAAAIWLAIGITIGTQGAKKPGSRLDRSLMIVALMGISLSIPWLSINMLWVWTDLIPIFPAGDYMTIGEGGIFQWAYHLILPGATLAILYSGVYGRLTRANVRRAMMEDHVKTAVAKGIDAKQVFHRHVLRVGLLPIIVIFGIDFGGLMGGAIFTESVFGLPGLGSYLMRGIGTLDLPILMVGVLIGATFVMLANIVVDVVQAAVDPRVRLT